MLTAYRPNRITQQWEDRLHKFCPNVWDIIIYESRGTKYPTEERLQRADIVILSHSLLSIGDHVTKFANRQWHRVIVDEAHCFKNLVAVKTKNLMRIVAKCARLWLLTATPNPTSAWNWGTYIRLFLQIPGCTLDPVEHFEKALGARRRSYSEEELRQLGIWILPLLHLRTRKTTITIKEMTLPIVKDQPLHVETIIIPYDGEDKRRWEENMREWLGDKLQMGRLRLSLVHYDIKTLMGACPGMELDTPKLRAGLKYVRDWIDELPETKILVFSLYPDCLLRFKKVPPFQFLLTEFVRSWTCAG